jgi:threonine dehydratase
MLSSLPGEQLQRGVVCASAGNHAQGFAYSCKKLGVKGTVFMPVITPQQKVQQTRFLANSLLILYWPAILSMIVPTLLKNLHRLIR